MKLKGIVLGVMVLIALGAQAQGYDREKEERSLGYTVCVDEENGTTHVLIHSIPVIRSMPEGIKNPIKGVRLINVTTGNARFVVAESKQGKRAVTASVQPIENETDQQLRARITSQDNIWDYAGLERDIEPATAHYVSERALIISGVLTRFRGYDDELDRMYGDDGSLQHCYLQGFKLIVRLPDHLYRLIWQEKGQEMVQASPWGEDPESFTDLHRLVQRAYKVGPCVEVEDRLAPSHIMVSCATGPLWEGDWGSPGKIMAEREIDPKLRYQKRSNDQGSFRAGLKKPTP